MIFYQAIVCWSTQQTEWEIKYGFDYFISLLPEEKFKLLLVWVWFITTMVSVFCIGNESNRKILKTGMIKVTDKISIPVPAGNGQYGMAHFMNEKELKKLAEVTVFSYSGKQVPEKGGLVLGLEAIGQIPKKHKKEAIVYLSEDRHSVIVGATRSGKSRRMILESIWLTVLSGQNLLITDPKGELWAYTCKFAQKHGYQTLVLDLREPEKGSHNNYLQEIIDAVEHHDIAQAIDYTWDLVSILVGEQKGEPIWYNGECATIASAILIVAMEAPKEYRNLTNVYYFLAYMAQPDEETDVMPFTLYLDTLEDTHPAKGVFAMAGIAHPKTRGSFFSSALGTLKYFTNPKIAEMTSKTDIKFSDTVTQKTIVYIIIPDEKTTLYSLGSMFIMQFYIFLVKAATKQGGRCPIDWNFFLDEFGQLPYIPMLPQFLSVGAGRGIRLHLVLQAFQQLKKNYKDDYETILNNCDAWIYLKCSVKDTKKEFSDRLGHYTVQSNSTSVSNTQHTIFDNHYTNSSNLISRPLLLEDEVGEIESPYSLISFAGKSPLMLIAPDLSFYRANKELGLGSKEENQTIYLKRTAEREKRRVETISLWGIWKKYMEAAKDEVDLMVPDEVERISFLN